MPTGSTNIKRVYAPYVGKWNAAQAQSSPSISSPSDPETVRRSIALISGGQLNKGTQNKTKELFATKDPRTNNSKTVMPTTADLKTYSWNLPPHEWSRPIDPTALDGSVGDSSKWDGASDPINRRGRIYYYLGVDSTQINDSGNNTGKNLNDRRYGFQFLWNPQMFATNVSVNMDITPSAQDKFVKVVGAFPSSETLSVTVKLDRTNDMFCLRSHNNKSSSLSSSYDLFYRYYSGGSYEFSAASSAAEKSAAREVFESKIKALQTLGTVADVEYLYKAINGAGWKSAATGRESSDIGFLSPTLLKIEIGPVSYIGYVAGINVQHNRFTKGMIPIETDVTLAFNLMATAGLSSRE